MRYFVPMIDSELKMRGIPLNMQGDKTLVYSNQIKDTHDVVAVFTPRKGG